MSNLRLLGAASFAGLGAADSCPVDQVYTQPPGCECHGDYLMAYADGKYWCQKTKSTSSGTKFDWGAAANAALPIAVGISCKLFNIGCPTLYSPNGIPAGYYETPWYGTAGGILGIVGGLAVVGGIGYAIYKK